MKIEQATTSAVVVAFHYVMAATRYIGLIAVVFA